MIEKYTFGKIIINNTTYTRDLKIIKMRVIPNWRRKTGHRVDINEIEDILEENPDILVIGKGNPGMMESTNLLRQLLINKGIKLIEESTPNAIQTFNKFLKEGKNVSAGFHLTC